MNSFVAYGVWWNPYNRYQGWVVLDTQLQDGKYRFIQTIKTAGDLELLKDELGLYSTDKDWQKQADKLGPWQLTWGGIIDIVRLYEGKYKLDIERPLLIDPHLGLPVDRYWNAEQYRSALPALVWKFDPWNGSYRKAYDIENDPYGELILTEPHRKTVVKERQ